MLSARPMRRTWEVKMVVYFMIFHLYTYRALSLSFSLSLAVLPSDGAVFGWMKSFRDQREREREREKKKDLKTKKERKEGRKEINKERNRKTPSPTQVLEPVGCLHRQGGQARHRPPVR